MKRLGYQALGFGVWNGAKWFVRRRYGNAPRNIALAGLVVAIVAALVFVGRKAATE